MQTDAELWRGESFSSNCLHYLRFYESSVHFHSSNARAKTRNSRSKFSIIIKFGSLEHWSSRISIAQVERTLFVLAGYVSSLVSNARSIRSSSLFLTLRTWLTLWEYKYWPSHRVRTWRDYGSVNHNRIVSRPKAGKSQFCHIHYIS